MSKKRIRLALDIALTAMIVFEMFIQYTGDFLHEIVGFTLFASVAVHLALSAKWMKGTARAVATGRLSARNAALTVMGCLLAIDLVVLIVSSVAISQIIASTGFTWTIGTYALWATVHSVSSYLLCALVTVHLAMHWAFLAHALRIPYNPERRRAIGMGVNVIATVGAVALGIMAAREALPQKLAVAAADKTDNEISAESDSSSGSADTSAPNTPNPSGEAPTATERHSKKRWHDSQDSQNRFRHGNDQDWTYDSNGQDQPSDNGSDNNFEYENNSDSEDQDTYSFDEEGFTGESDSSSTATGICTLCHKQCSLSAPRCNRPYEEGLI